MYGVRFPRIFMLELLVLIQNVSVIEVNFDIEHIKYSIPLWFNIASILQEHVSLIDINLNIEHIKYKVKYNIQV
jgi:hypothetical protein